MNPPFAFAFTFKVPAIAAVTPDVFAKANLNTSLVSEVKESEQPEGTLISSPVLLKLPTVNIAPLAAD